MGILDFLFGSNHQKIEDFKNRDAVILDVRTKQEWDAGHIKGATHIPVSEISAKFPAIKQWDKPVITCCASGVRSGKVAKELKKNGIDSINGGGWKSLQQKL